MPLFESNSTSINYEVSGQGFPVLALAPGGLRSRIAAWEAAPWHPVRALGDRFRVVTMDQRNAGASRGAMSARDGWATYRADQLALMDHLEIERFAVVGMCIGGAFIMSLASAAPARVACGVLLQPIGLEDNRDAFLDLARAWQRDVEADHPEATAADFEAFATSMFGRDFVFSVSEEEARECSVPLLVLMGSDLYHPASISRRLVELVGDCELIEKWKDAPQSAAAAARIEAFISEHAA